MQRLFNMERTSNPGTQSVAGWLYVKHALQSNLERVLTYYQLHPTSVNASHILNKIILTLEYGSHYDATIYESILDKSVTQYSSALGLTSSVSKGLLHSGEFYGEGSREIIIAHNQKNYDLEHICSDWQNICAVTVLHHPYTDLCIDIPSPRMRNIESGLAVIAINFNLLGLQYKMFKLNEDRLYKQTGKARRTLQQFINSYVIPGMLYSHLDYCVFNRLYNTFLEKPVNNKKSSHPFGLIDVNLKLEEVQKLQLKTISNSSYRFADILNTIGAVGDKSMLDVSRLPEMALTRQVLWGLVPSRLKMLSFLFRVSGEMGKALNIAEIERIKLILKELNTSRVMKSALPIDLYFDIQDELEAIAPGA